MTTRAEITLDELPDLLRPAMRLAGQLGYVTRLDGERVRLVARAGGAVEELHWREFSRRIVQEHQIAFG